MLITCAFLPACFGSQDFRYKLDENENFLYKFISEQVGSLRVEVKLTHISQIRFTRYAHTKFDLDFSPTTSEDENYFQEISTKKCGKDGGIKNLLESKEFNDHFNYEYKQMKSGVNFDTCSAKKYSDFQITKPIETSNGVEITVGINETDELYVTYKTEVKSLDFGVTGDKVIINNDFILRPSTSFNLNSQFQDFLSAVVVSFMFQGYNFVKENQRKARENKIIEKENLIIARNNPRKENQRIARENQIIARENQIIARENQRIARKNQRIATENQRIATENQRIARKNQRIATENQRIATENQRIATENQIIARENQRIATENRDNAGVKMGGEGNREWFWKKNEKKP
jgi:hypothetical protein